MMKGILSVPHVHISALQLLVNAMGVLILLGVMHAVARKYEGHPLADATLSVFA